MNDARAVEAVLNGDRSQYEELVERHQKMVYAIAWSHLGNRDLSEDAAQETFVKAFCSLRTLRDHGRFSYWLAQIARNVSRRFRQSAARESAAIGQWAAQASVEREGAASSDSLDSQLWESFATLPDTHREALTVFYIEGKSVAEAAMLLGISEAAMKVRLHRARTALRNRLEDKLEDSLETLRPSGQFTASVMSLLPLSPPGIIGAGGILGVLAKLVTGFFPALLKAVPQIGCVGLVMLWGWQSEAERLQNRPENEFRRKQLRYARGAMFLFVAIGLISMELSTHTLGRGDGEAFIFRLLGIVCLYCTWLQIWTLRVNSTPYAIGLAISAVAITGAFIATGFFGMDTSAFTFGIWVHVMVLMLTREKQPRRNDYNLFLRGETGGIIEAHAPVPPVPTLTDIQFRAFARFLGAQWLVKDYAIKEEELILKLPSARLAFGEVLPWNLGIGSYVSIGRMGECTALIGRKDRDAIEDVTNHDIDEDVLRARVCQAIQTALHAFVNGDAVKARQILTAQSDESIFRPGRHRLLMYILAVPPLVIIGVNYLRLIWIEVTAHFYN
jgi:RNA polymerase sigma factor (sigma-70 family)